MMSKKSNSKKVKFETLDNQYQDFKEFLTCLEYNMIKSKLKLNNLPSAQEQLKRSKNGRSEKAITGSATDKKTDKDFLFLKKAEENCDK